MKVRALKYGLVYVSPLVVWGALASKMLWSWSAVAIFFFVIPFLELFTKGSQENLTAAEEEMVKDDRAYDYLLYALVPIQYALLLFFLFSIGDPSLSVGVKVGMTSAMGMSCGIIGINAAHELGHRSTSYEKIMSKMLLLTTLYMHFFIEHNRGHHRHVGTDDDPASARYGETVYGFYFRSVLGSWLSAWRLEADRLAKNGEQTYGWRNEMFRYSIIQALLLALIGFILGSEVLLYFVLAATIGFLLLETVNYIEHYGLRRKRAGDHYERIRPEHSWNSNHPLGRLMLLELSRHSDHHYMASRKYPLLRYFDKSPQMPTGYPGMMLLALFPPLWFLVMHPLIRKYEIQMQQ